MTTVHLLALPHTELTHEYEWCAYTGKIRKLSDMLNKTGFRAITYSGEVAETKYNVPIIDREWQAQWFSMYDWGRDVFNLFDPQIEFWKDFNQRAITAIRERLEPGDILGITMGLSHKPVSEAIPELLPVELGIGYSGVWSNFRVYESYAWMHHLAGVYRDDDVKFYSTVIPNSFQAEDFPAGKGDGDYYLFIGRFIRRKGVQIAVEATERLGVPLIMAGQGAQELPGNRFKGIDIEVQGDHLKHVGAVGPAQRAELMGGAKAVFVPTIYLEPFGGVAVEAMMTGTPVITTDYGAFTETVKDGTGFRCHTLSEFVDAAREAPGLNRDIIRKYALTNYSTDTVRFQYARYLNRLQTLYGLGWYS